MGISTFKDAYIIFQKNSIYDFDKPLSKPLKSCMKLWN